MGWLDNVFASSTDDPRFAANMALFGSMIEGNMGGGLQGYAQAMSPEALARRKMAQLQMRKGAAEVDELERKLKDDAEARDVMRGVYGNSRAVQPQGALVGSESSAPSSGGGRSAGGANNVWMFYKKAGDAMAARGLVAQAQKNWELAEKFRPKYGHTPRKVRNEQGQLVEVLIGDTGDTMELPYGVAPEIELRDLGGTVQAIDKNATEGGQNWNKTMTHGDRISAGNLAVARERLAFDQNQPQYLETDNGIVALPKRPAPGTPLVGHPVVGADGQPLRKPLKPIPSSAAAAMVTNSQNLRRAEDALALVSGKNVGAMRGDPEATGWKGFLPNTALNIMDPDGVDARAGIADLGSMIIHDRSGAAVTAAEFPRLAPFIPRATDDNATVKKKLQRFVQIYQQEQEALNMAYGEGSGYRARAQRQEPEQERSAAPRSFDNLPPAHQYKGKVATNPDTGQRMRSNGLTWEPVK